MKLLILGATGMVGSRVTAEALSRGHSVIAASRKGTAVDGAEAVALDANDATAVADAATQADVIIGAVSPRSTDDATQEAITYGGAVIQAAGQSGKRLVMVGGAGTLNLPDGTPVAEVAPEEYRDEARGMRAVFEALEASDLDFTFLAPAALIEPGERTGTFRLGGRELLMDENGDSKISAEDYAIALLDEIESPAHPRQVFTVAY